ncbi:MAG TPA: molybdopterin converting factor subunit 1 [Thermoanaerobaculia bacterium]
MRIHLLYFASFRDIVGRDEETRELADGTSVRTLWQMLSREVPKFASFPNMPPAAVNREYARAETVLSDGDEVAFLPPVAGG